MNFFPMLSIIFLLYYHRNMEPNVLDNVHSFSVDSNINIEETSDDISYNDDGMFDESQQMLPIVTQDIAIGTKRKFSNSSSNTDTSSSEESFDYEAHRIHPSINIAKTSPIITTNTSTNLTPSSTSTEE